MRQRRFQKYGLTIEIRVAVEVADSSVRVNRFIGCMSQEKGVVVDVVAPCD